MKCPATIKTAGNHVISSTAQHTHEGNVETSRARAAVHQMKQKITENAVTPRVAQASVVAQLSNEVKFDVYRVGSVYFSRMILILKLSLDIFYITIT